MVPSKADADIALLTPFCSLALRALMKNGDKCHFALISHLIILINIDRNFGFTAPRQASVDGGNMAPEWYRPHRDMKLLRRALYATSLRQSCGLSLERWRFGSTESYILSNNLFSRGLRAIFSLFSGKYQQIIATQPFHGIYRIRKYREACANIIYRQLSLK